jgi:hypothetical protein
VSEIIAQRKLTKDFIDASPTPVVLTPRNRVRQPNGSYKWQYGLARQPQTMRVIEQAPPSVITLEDGTQRSLDYVLLAEWDAQLSKGDTFQFQGNTCLVLEVYHSNGYEVRGSVTRYLDAPAIT